MTRLLAIYLKCFSTKLVTSIVSIVQPPCDLLHIIHYLQQRELLMSEGIVVVEDAENIFAVVEKDWVNVVLEVSHRENCI